ncbi:MAG: hypothetical protein LJE89_01460 [Deltaproteobacteria bacterium]|nr:hypothetical protein [Deltaproteobacteria bacterium]
MLTSKGLPGINLKIATISALGLSHDVVSPCLRPHNKALTEAESGITFSLDLLASYFEVTSTRAKITVPLTASGMRRPLAHTEVTVMKQALLLTLVCSFFIIISPSLRQSSASEGQQTGQGPVLFDSYADSTVRLGNSWRVYLRARDKGGDMKSIVTLLSGPGSSPQSGITWLKKKYSHDVAGYIFLRIPLDRSLLNRTYTLQVFVRDSKDNKSEAVEFPLSFDLKKSTAELPPEWQDVADNKIGSMALEIKVERHPVAPDRF